MDQTFSFTVTLNGGCWRDMAWGRGFTYWFYLLSHGPATWEQGCLVLLLPCHRQGSVDPYWPCPCSPPKKGLSGSQSPAHNGCSAPSLLLHISQGSPASGKATSSLPSDHGPDLAQSTQRTFPLSKRLQPTSSSEFWSPSLRRTASSKFFFP